MSATQELIAASLTLADMDEHVAEMPTQAAADVREACARAMVQPDVSEVERLVRDYGNACRSDAVDVIATGGDPESCGAAHAALLDAVRAIVAERDHFRDAAKMLQPVSEVPMPEPSHESVVLEDGLYKINSRMYDEDKMRTYGEQCRAAGYAAGVAEMREHWRGALSGLMEIEDARIATGAFLPNAEAEARLDAARALLREERPTRKPPVAALRGEVKP